MKVLVTGAGGMLAQAVVPALERAGHHVLPLRRTEADVTRYPGLAHWTRAFRPDWIFHLAAFTHVDASEARPEQVQLVNAAGAGNAARAAEECGAAVLFLSTDYVFDGASTRPYTEDDPVAPQTIYGASKRAGELVVRETCARHLIVRTAWLYGRGGTNFVDTIRHKARAGEALRVVGDQRGAPTWTEDLAPALLALADRGEFGTFHVTAAGACTWHDLAAHVIGRCGCDVPLERIDSASLARPARRPPYSVLSLVKYERVTGRRMRPWHEAVDAYLEGEAEIRESNPKQREVRA